MIFTSLTDFVDLSSKNDFFSDDANKIIDCGTKLCCCMLWAKKIEFFPKISIEKQDLGTKKAERTILCGCEQICEKEGGEAAELKDVILDFGKTRWVKLYVLVFSCQIFF